MEIPQPFLMLMVLLSMWGCTVTTTTDMHGNKTRSVSFGSSQSELTGASYDHSTYTAPKQPSVSQNLFYFSGFNGRKPQLSTRNNSVSGTLNQGGSIEVDFALSADCNEGLSKRYMIALRFEKDQFPYQPTHSNTRLELYCDTQVIHLNPDDVTDFSKTKSVTTTVNGSTENQQQVKYFISLDFYVDEKTLLQIINSKKITFNCDIDDTQAVKASFTQTNYTILKEFAETLKQMNCSE